MDSLTQIVLRRRRRPVRTPDTGAAPPAPCSAPCPDRRLALLLPATIRWCTTSHRGWSHCCWCCLLAVALRRCAGAGNRCAKAAGLVVGHFLAPSPTRCWMPSPSTARAVCRCRNRRRCGRACSRDPGYTICGCWPCRQRRCSGRGRQRATCSSPAGIEQCLPAWSLLAKALVERQVAATVAIMAWRTRPASACRCPIPCSGGLW